MDQGARRGVLLGLAQVSPWTIVSYDKPRRNLRASASLDARSDPMAPSPGRESRAAPWRDLSLSRFPSLAAGVPEPPVQTAHPSCSPPASGISALKRRCQ